MALGDLTNEYQNLAGPEVFEKTPKSVWAAMAVSFAIRLAEDDPTKVRAILGQEWEALHANGIVPQKPIKEVR